MPEAAHRQAPGAAAGSWPPLLVIAGSTASGKSRLALRLAGALAQSGVRAEIVSADSRQVYRGMDIGTAKVSPAERAAVPHHGLDLVDPDASFTAADFAAEAARIVPAIGARGALALLVGGTGLSKRALPPTARPRSSRSCGRGPRGSPRPPIWPIRAGSSGPSSGPTSSAIACRIHRGAILRR